jgi:sugar phosphate isomerase/epimerase
MALAALPLPLARAGRIDSSVKGVKLGVTTFSFRDLRRIAGQDNVDDIVRAVTACGAGEIELNSTNIEPASASGQPSAFGPTYGAARGVHPVLTPGQIGIRKMDRENLRRWRLTTADSYYRAVRRTFDDAGIDIFAFTLGFADDFADDEIDACFNQAKALGVDLIVSSPVVAMTLPMARRVAPFAEKHRIRVAAPPDIFAAALAMSKYMRVNPDIGQLTAANHDAVAYIEQNHQNITHLHVKDRKRNDGASEPFGDGDTPIKRVLTLIRDNRWPIPALVEYEYPGMGAAVEEVKKCLDYMRSCLTQAA